MTSILAPTTTTNHKSSAQVLCNTDDGIMLSQLPKPSLKGDSVSIKITQDEYHKAVDDRRNHLHGRLVLGKGNETTYF
jgi:hypothetical protein